MWGKKIVGRTDETKENHEPRVNLLGKPIFKNVNFYEG